MASKSWKSKTGITSVCLGVAISAFFFLSAFQNTPSQNIVKRPNQQLQPTAPRNSNLRELPIAPSHALEVSNNRRTSTPAAQVKPITSTASATKTVAGVGNSQGRPEVKAKAITPVAQAKPEAKSETEVSCFFFSVFKKKAHLKLFVSDCKHI